MKKQLRVVCADRVRPYRRLLVSSCILIASSLLSGCGSTDYQSSTAKMVEEEKPLPSNSVEAENPRATEAVASIRTHADLVQIYPATNRFVAAAVESSGTEPASDDVTLNFQKADIAEVVKNVLGDILQKNYTLHSEVQGKVTLRTTNPLPRSALISILEMLLRANGADLVERQGLYEVVPDSQVATRGLKPRLRLSADKGYQLLVVPLQFIAASEMAEIIAPIKPERMLLQVDDYRNLITLGGSQAELSSVMESIRLFDVDQLKGMSVGLFRLQHVEASHVLTELQHIFGNEASGLLKNVVRMSTIDRLNALLVVTPQKRYLQDVKTWIARLDHSENTGGMNMYVYYVQNGKASNLADLLDQLFQGKRQNVSQLQGAGRDQGENKTKVTESKADASRTEKSESPRSRSVSKGSGSSLDVGDVTIIAQEENNALLILASPSDYAEIERALLRLDVMPMQVLVEATIAEVTLDDELRYGLQWFFKGSHGGKTSQGGLNIPPDGFSEIVPLVADPSLTYAVFDGDSTRALLNILAADSRLNVLSSPTLMVLDNHEAMIRVGDQVPIRTSETTNTSGAIPIEGGNTGALVTSTIQYHDTGVLLEVTPRVNAGGMVILDISQEVNDVDETTTSSIDSPTIIQRKIKTSVAVQNGETIVLGGLIKENKADASTGVPFLKDLPLVGWLFSAKAKIKNRTELLVMITPNTVSNVNEARSVTEEYREKLKDVGI